MSDRAIPIDGRSYQIDGRAVARRAIPDSENLHAQYDLQSQTESDGQTIDPLVDQSGNGRDASAVGDPTMDVDGFNSNPTAVLDGVDDGWDVSDADWGNLTQPFTVYAVFNLRSSGDQYRFFIDNTELTSFLWNPNSGNGWGYYGGSTSVYGSEDSTVNDFAVVYDGADSLLEEAGTQTASGDGGSGDISASVGIGYRASDNSEYSPIDLCEMMFYDAAHDSTTRTDVRNYLVDRWGL